MAFTQFPSELYSISFGTDLTINIGSFQDLVNGELAHIRVLLYIIGTRGGSERVRLKVYGNARYETAYATSDWIDLDDLSYTSNWLGYVRADFDRQNINKNNTYYLQAVIENYTENGSTFHIGLIFDFPRPVYDNGSSLFFDHNPAFELFTYKEPT